MNAVARELKFVVEIDNTYTYKFYISFCMSVITDMATMWPFEIVSDTLQIVGTVLERSLSL
jgi:hypothetical protein